MLIFAILFRFMYLPQITTLRVNFVFDGQRESQKSCINLQKMAEKYEGIPQL